MKCTCNKELELAFSDVQDEFERDYYTCKCGKGFKVTKIIEEMDKRDIEIMLMALEGIHADS